MEENAPERIDEPALRLLEADESVQVVTDASNARIFVTDRRLIISAHDRITLDLPFDGLRRIQFDIERERPATLVIVPERPSREPQVLGIPPERYAQVGHALTLIGHRLADLP